MNCPGPLVAIFPEIFNEVPDAAVIPETRKLILLKFCVPVPLIMLEGPSNEIVPVLPLKVPSLTQLPPTVWEKLPALKIVDTPISTFPFIIILEAAVKETDVPEPFKLLKFPSIVKPVAGKVFVDAADLLEKIRFPYVFAAIV